MSREYLLPASIKECLDILASRPGARVIAGGTDLMIEVKEGDRQVNTFVDITRIPELCRIREEGNAIVVGAAATHAMVAASKLLRERLPALPAAAAAVGSAQVRNVGTVGGNVVNAQPAADTAVALTALGAVAKTVSAAGERLVPVGDTYAGVGRSLIDPGKELLAELIIEKWGEGDSSAFARLSPRRALSLPILNAAVRVQVEKGICTRARICVAPVAARPLLTLGAAELLIGKKPGDDTIAAAARAAMDAAAPRDSVIRGSGAYRKEMTFVLVSRALTEAFLRVTNIDRI